MSFAGQCARVRLQIGLQFPVGDRGGEKGVLRHLPILTYGVDHQAQPEGQFCVKRRRMVANWLPE